MRDRVVVVFMKKARQKEENIANAVMDFLPRAVLPRARRYVDTDTNALCRSDPRARDPSGQSHADGRDRRVCEKHPGPCTKGGELKQKLEQIDTVDMHGWLTRVMLNEYRRT